jgi:hypothetical protein
MLTPATSLLYVLDHGSWFMVTTILFGTMNPERYMHMNPNIDAIAVASGHDSN